VQTRCRRQVPRMRHCRARTRCVLSCKQSEATHGFRPVRVRKRVTRELLEGTCIRAGRDVSYRKDDPEDAGGCVD